MRKDKHNDPSGERRRWLQWRRPRLAGAPNPQGSEPVAVSCLKPVAQKTWLVMAMLGLALSLAVAARATVVEKQSLEQLVAKADLVAIGRVMDVVELPTSDQKFAYTYVILSELEVLHGAYADPTLTLRMEGGGLGNGKVLHIPGMPRFSVGEKVVVFVKGNTERICPLAGWEQGHLRVEQDKTTGREVLRTSEGKRIHAVQDGDFVRETDPNDRSTASAGTPDYGVGHDVAAAQNARANEDLSVEDLKREVQALRIKTGVHNRPAAAVHSANWKLDSPQPRQLKQKEGRNQL